MTSLILCKIAHNTIRRRNIAMLSTRCRRNAPIAAGDVEYFFLLLGRITGAESVAMFFSYKITPATWWELRGGHAGPRPLACASHRPAASSPPPISYLSKAPPCKKRKAPESTNKNILGFLGFPTVLASSSLQMDVILAAASSSQRPPS